MASSAIHDACSEFNVTRFQTERAKFKTTIFNKITANFAVVYGIVSDVQVCCDVLIFICLYDKKL